MSSDINKNISDEADTGVLAGNLRTLTTKAGVDSSQLSKKTGIALTTINGLKRGIGNPTLSTLHQLANFFNVSIGDLTEKNLAINTHETPRITYEIPLISMDELSGYLDNQNKFKNTISTELESRKPDKYYAIKIFNNALQPLFEKGSIFVIAKDSHVHDGDIVLVQFDRHPPCFRKIFIEGKSYFFKPVSELIDNNIVKHGNFVIHGIVIKAIQHFHG